VFKSSLIYLATSIINRGIPLVMLPILTAYLLPAEYGYISLFQLIISFTHPLINLNGNLLISKEFKLVSKETMQLINGNYLYVVIAFTAVICLIVFGLNLFFSVNLILPMKWWALALLSGVLSSVYLNYLTLLRCLNKPYNYSVLEVLKTVLDVGLTLGLVILLGLSWKGRAYGILFAISSFGILAFYLSFRSGYLKLSYNKDVFNKILKFCIPLIPFSLGSIIINFSDRLFIEKLVGVKDLGLYSVAYTIGMSIMIFTESFNKAWNPSFFQLVLNYTRNKRKIFMVTIWYTVSILFMPILIYIICKFIIYPYFINIKYQSSLKFVIGVAFAYAFHGIFLVLYPFLVWKNKTSIVGVITVVAMALNLALNYILISRYSLSGAVWATQGTYGFMAIATFFYVVYLLRHKSVDIEGR
jgi:O-antigen/teichoic acid export membrane protein